MSVMRVDDLSVRRGDRRILDGVGCTVSGGEVIGVIGPNGAGKTTLLRVMAGLLRPDLGSVALDGRAIGDWPRRERARRMAYLPQDAPCHWPMAAERLVALGRLPHLGPWQHLSGQDEQAVLSAMTFTDVIGLAKRSVDTLSGGERARVLLARALAGEPDLLLADEPVAELDPLHRLDVMEHLKRLSEAGAAVVVALHDLTLAARFCKRLVMLDSGRLAATGAPEEVLSPERLATVYQVEAVKGHHAGEPFLVPWRPHPNRREADQ
jgi:iron complex transport system ATP-binding protein